MKNSKFLIQLLVMTMLLCLTAGTSRADDLSKYKAFADIIRKQWWSKKMPHFESAKVPDNYKNKGTVMLAYYNEVQVDQKSGLKLSGYTLGIETKHKLKCTKVNRLLIHISDADALKEFSEFNFQVYEKRYNYGWKQKTQRVLGVRVFKKDGSVHPVNTDDYIFTTEGKKDKDNIQKLAVPGLQIGDAIDILTYTQAELQEQSLPAFTFTYEDEKPIVWQGIHMVVDKALTTQYRLLNGAPDFKKSIDADGNIVLDAEVNNVEKVTPTLWYDDALQTPMAIINISGRKLKGEYIPPSIKKKGLQDNMSAETIINDAYDAYKIFYSITSPVRVKTGKPEGFADINERVEYIYNMCRYDWCYTSNTMDNGMDFAAKFIKTLKKFKINGAQLVLTTTKGTEPIDELSIWENAECLVYVPESQKFYVSPYYFLAAGELPSSIQGRKAYKKVEDKPKAEGSFFNLPTSDASQNVINFNLDVTPTEGTDLHVHFTETYKGAVKHPSSTLLIPFNEVIDTYHAMNPEAESYAENGSKKDAQKRKEQADKWAENSQDALKEDIKNYWDESPKQIENVKLTHYGLTTKNPLLTIEGDYEVEGLLKRAGKNFILSSGGLMGALMKVEEKDRKRTADINMPCPLTILWNINVDLPAGYQVNAESLKNLNKTVKNDCAAWNLLQWSMEGN